VDVKKVAFHTLGCKLNFAETSTIARTLEGHGYQQVDFNEKADVYVINTCSVTARADKKSEEAARKARNQNPDARVVMVGCYAQLEANKIARLPGIDLILGNEEKFNLAEHLQAWEHGETSRVHTASLVSAPGYHPAYSWGDRTRSFLKVQDGCDYRCAYCTIPAARGKSRNQPVREIVAQAEQLGAAGAKEIILTGVNIGDFGKSTGESFLDLIQALEKVPGIERYRISSIEPNLLNESIVSFVAQSDKFLPHFHMPLQSGNNEILGKMRRRYNKELFEEKSHLIRDRLPDAFIGVDLIVGFPGEDASRFQKTFDFLQKLDVSYYHVFSFSARPGTPAETMNPKIPGKTIKARSHMVQELAEKKKYNFYTAHVGQTRPVLFEKNMKNGNISGFTDNYIRVSTPSRPSLAGQIKDVYLQQINRDGTLKGIPQH